MDVKIKEIPIENIYDFFTVIKENLNQCKDIQVFISDMLLERIIKDNYMHLIWKETIINSCGDDEKAYIFEIKINNEIKIFQMHIVKKSSDYVSLTYFAVKGMIYCSRLNGMKKILIINSDQK